MQEERAEETGKYRFLKWLKNWVKICRIIRVLRDCEAKMWRPSGLSSSVILSSAFSSLVLPSTWQGFPLHSWLYNLSVSLSITHTLMCVNPPPCVSACVRMHTRMCACVIWLGAACKHVICGEDLWSYCRYLIAVCQIYTAIWPTNKALVHNCGRGRGIPFTHPSIIIF